MVLSRNAGITSRLLLANTPLRRSPVENAGKTAHLVFLVDKSREAHRVWQVMSLGVTTEHPGQCLLS